MNYHQAADLKLFVRRLASRFDLTNLEKDSLLSLKARFWEIPNNKDILDTKDLRKNCHFVIDGLIGSFEHAKNGSRQITAIHIPGDMADLATLMFSRAQTHLTALARSAILIVEHDELGRLLREHPALAEAFWRDCIADASVLSQWVVNVGRRSATARLAHLFCEMAVRHENSGWGNKRSFPLPISQLHLADVLGLTSVHVNRTLRELREKSIMAFRKGIVAISDWDALVEAGGFDPGYLLLGPPVPRII